MAERQSWKSYHDAVEYLTPLAQWDQDACGYVPPRHIVTMTAVEIGFIIRAEQRVTESQERSHRAAEESHRLHRQLETMSRELARSKVKIKILEGHPVVANTARGIMP